MCFDSNRKFINFRKLWTLDGSKRHKCSTLTSVRGVIEREKVEELEYFFINVGVNDIDEKTPEAIVEEYEGIIDHLNEKYPGIKIIACEITPRNDAKDNDVIAANKLIADLCKRRERVYLVEHSNLRDDRYTKLYDSRHIHRNAIRLFASNIKKGLRRAYGQPEPYKKRNQSLNASHPFST